MRVWDMITGSNTLANFGPGLKNAHTTALYPLIAPSYLSPPGQEVIYFPNPREITSFDLHTGAPLKRLRVPGLPGMNSSSNSRNLRPRTTALAWRAHHIEMYSAHGDGAIRCWRPRTWEDAEEDKEGLENDGRAESDVERKRKRDELDQIVQDLTKKRTTWS